MQWNRSWILRCLAEALVARERVAFQRPWMRMLIELHLVHSLKSSQVSRLQRFLPNYRKLVFPCVRQYPLGCLPDDVGSTRLVPSPSALKREVMVLDRHLLRCLTLQLLGGNPGYHPWVRASDHSYLETASSALRLQMMVSLSV